MVISGSSYTPVAEIYDPANGRWDATGSLNRGRDQISPAVLSDGRVLVAGGRNGGEFLATAEIYDPNLGSWRSTGPLNVTRTAAILVRLLDGRVLAISGYVTPDTGTHATEIFDPRTETWSMAADSLGTHGDYARASSGNGVLLDDGRVLVVGTTGGESTKTEAYNPSTNTWSYVGDLALPRTNAHMIKLRDGRVLLAGGAADTSGLFADSEIFNPATNQWTQTGALNFGRYGNDMVLLPDGRVLVAGGCYRASDNIPCADLLPSEIYDPALGTWEVSGSLLSGHHAGAMALLSNNTVLITNGWTDNNTTMTTDTETYTLGAGRADLKARLAAPGSIPRGGTFTVTVQVSNLGPNSAAAVLTGVDVGLGLTITSTVGGSIAPGAHVVYWKTSAIPAGSSVTLAMTVKAAGAPRPYVAALAAGTASSTPDPVAVNNLAGLLVSVT